MVCTENRSRLHEEPTSFEPPELACGVQCFTSVHYLHNFYNGEYCTSKIFLTNIINSKLNLKKYKRCWSEPGSLCFIHVCFTTQTREYFSRGSYLLSWKEGNVFRVCMCIFWHTIEPKWLIVFSCECCQVVRLTLSASQLKKTIKIYFKKTLISVLSFFSFLQWIFKDDRYWRSPVLLYKII